MNCAMRRANRLAAVQSRLKGFLPDPEDGFKIYVFLAQIPDMPRILAFFFQPLYSFVIDRWVRMCT